MYYDSNDNTCKYYCREGYNQQTASCSSIQKVQNSKTDLIQINNNQDQDIQQILLVEIQGTPTIIAIDTTMVIYYKYPELKPYYSISLNATSYMTYSTQNYINILLNDFVKIVRINILSNNIESYQLPFQSEAVIQLGLYLFNLNQNNNQLSFSMFNLDTAFNLTTFQVQLQQQRILQKSNTLDIVEYYQDQEDYNFEFNNHKNTSEKKLLYVDSKGCNVYALSNLNTTSQLITDPLISVNIPLVQNNIYTLSQPNNQLSIQNQNLIFFIDQMKTILFYNIKYSSLYNINALNTTRTSILGTFSNSQLQFTQYVNASSTSSGILGTFSNSQLQCTQYVNASSTSSGYVIPLYQNSTSYFLNYNQQIVIKLGTISLMEEGKYDFELNQTPDFTIYVYNFTSYSSVCFVYQFGFNFIFFQQHQQSIQNFVDFQIDKAYYIDQYIILYNDIANRNLIFDLSQQKLSSLNIPNNSQNQTFIINNGQYLFVLVLLNNSSLKLYVINCKQGALGFDLNFFLADQLTNLLFQYFQDKIYIPSNTNTAVAFLYQNGALTFSNSFYYNTAYYIYNYTHLFLLSACKYFQNQVVTLFNTQKQANTQILFQYPVSSLFQNQFIVFDYTLPPVLYNTDVVGAVSTKIYNVTSNLTLSYQIQTTFTNYFKVKTYVQNTSQSLSYSYNVATIVTNDLPQYPFSTQAQTKYAFIYGSASLLPVNFPTQNFIGIYSLNKQSYLQQVQQQGSQIPIFQLLNQNELITYDTLYSQSAFLIDSLSMVQIPKSYAISQTIYCQQKIFFTVQASQIGYIDLKNKIVQLLSTQGLILGYTIFQNQLYYAAKLDNNTYLFNSTSQFMFQIPELKYIYFEQLINMMIVLQNNFQNLVKYKLSYQYFNSLNLVLITIDNQIGYFVNYENASYFQLKTDQTQIQFQDGLFTRGNQIVTFQYTSIFLFSVSTNGFFNSVASSQVIWINFSNCNSLVQNKIGISFQSFNYGMQGQYIFTQEQMDLLTLVSQSSFEIYLLSTLTYLRTTLVNGLQLNPYLAVSNSNEIIIPSENWFYIIDTCRQIFKKQVNLNKSTRINFVVFQDLNQVAQLNQNSGIIDVKNIQDFSLSQQIKLKTPFTKSKYNFFSLKFLLLNYWSFLFSHNIMSQIYKIKAI
ncbi:hypothetical protein ABPG72_022282 [Tetrahymena utriculariae]